MCKNFGVRYYFLIFSNENFNCDKRKAWLETSPYDVRKEDFEKTKDIRRRFWSFLVTDNRLTLIEIQSFEIPFKFSLAQMCFPKMHKPFVAISPVPFADASDSNVLRESGDFRKCVSKWKHVRMQPVVIRV